MLALGCLSLGCSPSGKANSASSLIIRSEPAGASISVHNENLGKTPLSISMEKIKTASPTRLDLKLDGYHPVSVRIALEDSFYETSASISFSGSAAIGGVSQTPTSNGLLQPELFLELIPLSENYPGSGDVSATFRGRYHR